ncbi:MAG: hypothetical protein ACYCOO_05665 [Chitinophagaceae bacterium]
MKKIIPFGMAIWLVLNCIPAKSRAQSQEVQQLLLDIQKLHQLKNILHQMVTGYQMLSQGYGRIRLISRGSDSLQQGFLDGLGVINPLIGQSGEVRAIFQDQQQVQNSCHQLLREVSQGEDQLTPGDIQDLQWVAHRQLERSSQLLEEVVAVLSSHALLISDAKRLQILERMERDSRDQLRFLLPFIQRCQLLITQRSLAEKEIKTIQQLNG